MAEDGFQPLSGLVQEAEGLYFAPVRHHSPACAWAVRAMIAEVKPAHVLIEAPVDFEPHIPVLLNPETRPPVAIASLIDQKTDDDDISRIAAYVPFCVHSPELVALQEGSRVGAKLSMIDLPSAQMRRLSDTPAGQVAPLSAEDHFDSGDYIDALVRQTGCRDGFELWDHLFETRLGQADWRAFFQAVGTYCAGIRAATPDLETQRAGDLAREAHMAEAIRKAKRDGPVVIVAGGFHVPALTEPANTPHVDPPDALGTSKSYLVRYGFEAMDALSGYAAGLPQPAYYDDLWNMANTAKGAPAWQDTALELVTRFARKMRDDGHAIAVPAQVEMLRMADGLAAMRARPGALRHDLIDAARSALVKGEVNRTEVWTERLLHFLRGSALGNVPPSAGSPPLVEDARQRAAALRFDISDGARRRRSLDIRRKDRHLAASRYLHALALLDIGFAQRDSGPDFVNGARTDLLFEDWSYAWSPTVEGRLIEAAVLGDDIPSACLGLLNRERRALEDHGESRNLGRLTTLLSRGLLAGLGSKLGPFLDTLADEIRTHGAFGAVAQCLRQLQNLSQSRGPLAIPNTLDVTGLRDAAYHRILYLCDTLPQTKPEDIAPCLDGLRIVIEVLQSQDGEALDQSLFEEAMDRVATADPPPEILGAVLAISVQSGRRVPEALVTAMIGNFNGSLPQLEDRIGVLRGVLSAAPSLLWTIDALLDAVDEFLLSLEADQFLELLPHLRLLLTILNPRETDRIARLLAKRHGGSSQNFQSDGTVSEADLHRALAAEKVTRAAVEADGLGAWLLEGAP